MHAQIHEERYIHIPAKSTSSISTGRVLLRTDDTGCLVCIDYRMHQCALRESAPIPRVLKRIACMRSAYTYTRASLGRVYAYAIHVYRFLSRIQRTCTFIEIRHRRSFRRQAAKSRRRNNRVRRFFDLLEIESIARWSSEKCIYTAIEFHRVDCTIDIAHSLSFRRTARSFQKNACHTGEST